MSTIKDRLMLVLEQIRAAEQAAGRPSGSVRLCAVSKFHATEAVRQAMDAGQLLFGESRVQEARQKFESVQGAELHIIGQLQRNKVRDAVRIASCVQSVDRLPLLEEIERQCERFGRRTDILFEVHTGEDTKAGYTDMGALRQSVEALCAGQFPHITPRGFMTMAPLTGDERAIRRAFASVRELSERYRAEFPRLPLTELSMGMSGDFRLAIAEGSTMVRIGTAIFGERDYGG